MNIWYTISDIVDPDLYEDLEVEGYEFEQFSSRKEAYSNIPRIRSKFYSKPVVATVDWTDEFWKKIYKERQDDLC
jgi:hypothetical protein